MDSMDIYPFFWPWKPWKMMIPIYITMISKPPFPKPVLEMMIHKGLYPPCRKQVMFDHSVFFEDSLGLFNTAL